MSETTFKYEVTRLLREQVELSKQILAELQKHNTTMHAAEHLLTDKVVEQDVKDAEPKMRPIEDWLNELPEPIRSKALDSVDKESNHYKSNSGKVENYLDAIYKRNDASGNTKEGLEYWYDIYIQLEAGTPPSELVDPVDLDKSMQ